MKPNATKLASAFLLFALAAFFGAGHLRAQTTVYTNTDGSIGTFSGVTGTASGGQQSTAPLGETFRELPFLNSTFTLTISGLTPFSNVALSLDLYAIQSLDGNGPFGGNGSGNPDLFTISFAGGTLLNASFANYNGNTQTYPSMYSGPSGIVNNAPGTGSSAQNTLGYTYGGSIGDATYALAYMAMADSTGSITFTFVGGQNQSPGDESFGIDNINVTGFVVPEPQTWALILGGAGLLMAFRVRRVRPA